MKNKIRKLAVGILGVGLLAMGWAGKAEAAYTDSIMTNNTAQITITITPSIDRSVTISTGNVNMDLGVLALGVGVTTQTVTPATVTVQGTITNTDLWLSANIAGGWAFDINSADQETDKLATWMTLTSTATTATPAQTGSAFNGTTAVAGSDLVDGSFTRIGSDAAAGAGRFEDGTTDTDHLAAGTFERHLWTYFRLPNGSSVTNAQKITFILTVDQGL